MPVRLSAERSRATARLYLTAAVLGAAVGLVSVAFLGAVHLLETLIWDDIWNDTGLSDHPGWGAVLVCGLGGLLVGIVNRGAHPRTHADQTVHDVDAAMRDAAGPPPRPAGILRLATLGIVSLGFGGALGPEAPLIAVVTALAGRLHRILHLTRAETLQFSLAAAVGGLFGAPLGAVALAVEDPKDGNGRLGRLDRAGPSVVAAVTGLWVLVAVLPQGSLDRFTITVNPDDEIGLALVAALIAACLAAAAGLLLHALLVPAQRLAARVAPPLVLRGALGGIVLGACAAISPLVLFSGHHQIQELFDSVGERTAAVLVGLALLKLVAVVACLATGWYGGEIFPAAMIGTTIGLAVAEVTGTEAVGAVAAAGLVAAAATALRRPIAALLVFVVFIPAGTLVAASLGAAVGAGLLAMRTPPAPPDESDEVAHTGDQPTLR